VVASTVLTDETVLSQHNAMVPFDIEVATVADTGYSAREYAVEQPPSSLPLTMKLNNLPERPSTCPLDPLDSSRSARRSGGRTVPKETDGDLEITVITHPNGSGVVVSNLGPDGACAKHGLKVGDTITMVNGIPATDHRTAIWLIDQAVGVARFAIADKTKKLLIGRKHGVDVGITCVNNTQTGYGVVVADIIDGFAGWNAGLRVGSVILSVDGILAFEHQQTIKQIDEAVGVARLVVASTVLTDETVLSQHNAMVPCDIEVATMPCVNVDCADQI